MWVLAGESGEDLASQPTISRMEKTRLALAPATESLKPWASCMSPSARQGRRSEEDPPRLRRDGRDPTHGEQEESYYHGYFGEHIYHPLLVFDAQTGQLITAVLRPGNTHASRGTVAILKRIVKRLREQWPKLETRD